MNKTTWYAQPVLQVVLLGGAVVNNLLAASG